MWLSDSVRLRTSAGASTGWRRRSSSPRSTPAAKPAMRSSGLETSSTQQPDRVVTAPTWGGNLEILHWTLAVGRWIRPAKDYAGCVLILETSEEIPSSEEVFRILRNMGERGLLAQFPAVVFGTAKATSIDRPVSPDKREPYRTAQRDAVLAAFEAYHPEAMIVFNVDIGHTDPQWVLPYGGSLTVDGPARTITASYGLPNS